jgi:hypothetical protein
MKILVITVVSIILLLFLGWPTEDSTIEEEVEVQLHNSETLQDSALIILKEIHDTNDSLLMKHFN